MSTYVSVLVLASMLAACTSLPPHDPMDAYRRYEQALNAGDVAATAAVWAADASFAGALGCPMPRPCISRAAIRSGFIEPAVAMKMQHQMVGEPEPDGADGATVRLQIGWPGMEKIAQGVTRIVECAPGKVLAGLVKRTVDGVEAVAITDSAALAAAIA